ncbi:MAG: hypothetical protein WC799_01375 [Desulfobacteraceae bacterium]
MNSNLENIHDHSLCIACFSRLSEYIDKELCDAVCSDVKKHLEECTCCSACLTTLRKTIELCGCVADKPVPENLSVRLKALAQEMSQ